MTKKCNDGSQSITYSASEAAALLGVGLNFFYECLNANRIPALKLGSTWRIPKKAFHAFIESGAELTSEEWKAKRRA